VKRVAGFLKDENGATAIEYGLIVGLVALVAVGALTTIGTNLREILQSISDKLLGVTAK
jgi:pilus assembly protein Flp/PilA